MPRVALIGTLDTKADECAFLRQSLLDAGCEPLVVDVGIVSEPGFPPDVSAAVVAASPGPT